MAGSSRGNFSIFGEDDAKSQSTDAESERSVSTSSESRSNLIGSNERNDEANDQQLGEQSDSAESEDLEDYTLDTDSISETHPDTHVPFIKTLESLNENEKRDKFRPAKELMKTLASLESSNLTRHLFTHYLEYGKSRFVSTKDLDSSESANRVKRSRVYSSWPLEPHNVPRAGDEVWPDSLVSKDAWTPSRNLEEAILSVMLRRARNQWSRKLDESEEVDQGSKNNEKTTSRSAQRWTNLKRKASEADDPVFSADEEHSFKILKPSIRSVISSVDSLLYAMHQSNNRPTIKRKETSYGEENTSSKRDEVDGHLKQVPTIVQAYPRDWSNVLGIAGLVGIPSDVLSRTTVRCAALFGEKMEFTDLREQNSSHSVDILTVGPADFANPIARDKLVNFKPSTWTINQGCPFPDCSWYGLTTEVKSVGTIKFHIRHKHNLQLMNESERDEVVRSRTGAIHLDGFMEPVPRVWKRTVLKGRASEAAGNLH